MHGDAESLPFADRSFDAVINVEASHAYPHFPRFLAEVARVLRPADISSTLIYAAICNFPSGRKRWPMPRCDCSRRGSSMKRFCAALDKLSPRYLELVGQPSSLLSCAPSPPILLAPFRRCTATCKRRLSFDESLSPVDVASRPEARSVNDPHRTETCRRRLTRTNNTMTPSDGSEWSPARSTIPHTLAEVVGQRCRVSILDAFAVRRYPPPGRPPPCARTTPRL